VAQPIRIAPSLLAADFTHLADEVRSVEQGGADWLHLDVMDGHFVPNLTFGAPMVAALHRLTKLPLDVHLMIDEPLAFLPAFADAGSAIFTVHVEAPGVAGPGWPAPVRSRGEGGTDGPAPEAKPHVIDHARLRATLAAIRARGMQAGLALRPDTQLEEVTPVLDAVDLLLVMTVYPGFSGQPFLDGPLATIERAAEFKRAHGAQFTIEVDGGIEASGTGPRAARAGAEALVAGHGIYRQGDPVAAIRALRELSR